MMGIIFFQYLATNNFNTVILYIMWSSVDCDEASSMTPEDKPKFKVKYFNSN